MTRVSNIERVHNEPLARLQVLPFPFLSKINVRNELSDPVSLIDVHNAFPKSTNSREKVISRFEFGEVTPNYGCWFPLTLDDAWSQRVCGIEHIAIRMYIRQPGGIIISDYD